ncbi:bifunctional DNA-binding transcriptional regulator/O6-methylguanine-DNA methyltransferase Ada [Microvirga sp. W0021]|uniref:Bifunctional DNA-binding transcriptional regulator/O6-methylguanine-DNA methyltransferase Ada n=1 Tax=Hohaiivirga grylli TaxID=3133970 RepID=A0ABV0BHT3_9HYPH
MTDDINTIRWQALQNKDRQADGTFIYAVKTTGIYCRPSCPSKLPKAENVTFFDSWQEAEQAGYRACMRCKPNQESVAERNGRLVAKACRLLEESAGDLKLDDLAAAVGLSPYFFHKQFRQITGVTPKEYSTQIRMKIMQENLSENKSRITDAIYDAGYGSSSRFYEKSDSALGMTPTEFRKGGKDKQIFFALAECSLGSVLVAQSQKGIVSIALGDDPDALLQELQDRFPQAELIGDNKDFDQVVASVIGMIERPGTSLSLPLDIRGTAFQKRVWSALQKIPPGTTFSYSQLAEAIGQPSASRAVARACAQNTLAIAVPCHRVVRQNGDISGYRWGVERKREILTREGAVVH